MERMMGGMTTWRVRRLVVALSVCCMAVGCDRTATLTRQDITDEDSPPKLASIVRSMIPRLERLSGLDRTETLRVREQDRAAVRRYVEERLDEELPRAELEGIHASYVLLGLIPDTLDLRALLLDLYTEQVLGYYDPKSRTLYVVSGEDEDALRPVLAHELVHALQDQHTNLDSLIARERGNDRQTAAHAAMEGHAMVVMFALLAELASRKTVDPAALPSPAQELRPALAAQSESFPVFRRAPNIVRETLLFPYVAGSDFVHTLWSQQRGAERYPAPIDTLLPQSTQQIMEPLERFIRQRTEPVELRFDMPADAQPLYENTLGQLEIGIFLAQHLGEGARAAASGWRGDRLLVLRAGAGTALLWVSVWDSTATARRFADALRRSRTGRADRHVLVEEIDVAGSAAVRMSDVPAGADTSLGRSLRAIPVSVR